MLGRLQVGDGWGERLRQEKGYGIEEQRNRRKLA
jgi:hypothetical protein